MTDPQPPGQAADAPERVLATRLALAGLVPFVVLSLWLAGIPADHVWRDTTIRLLATYAAVVLSFLGGARWALAIAGGYPQARRDIAISILPPLLGWAAPFVAPHVAFVLLAVGFAAHGAWDALSGQAGVLPAWLARLRSQLTAAAVVSMIVAFAATAAG